MKYRELFSVLDAVAGRIQEAIDEIEAARDKVKLLKSELWNRHTENGGKDVHIDKPHA